MICIRCICLHEMYISELVGFSIIRDGQEIVLRSKSGLTYAQAAFQLSTCTRAPQRGPRASGHSSPAPPRACSLQTCPSGLHASLLMQTQVCTDKQHHSHGVHACT